MEPKPRKPTAEWSVCISSDNQLCFSIYFLQTFVAEILRILRLRKTYANLEYR